MTTSGTQRSNRASPYRTRPICSRSGELLPAIPGRRRGDGEDGAMRVLVTGGSGFIGSRIVRRLLDDGAAVRVLDLVPANDDRAESVVGNLADPRTAAIAVSGVDAVCHQAARVGLGVDFGDVRGYVEANDTGTAVLLDALWRRSFTGPLVVAGSMVVYGEGRSRCTVHGVVHPGPRMPDDLAAGR